MFTKKKPRGIYVRLYDSETNKSKCLTVYGASLEEVYARLSFYLERVSSTKGTVQIKVEAEGDEETIE